MIGMAIIKLFVCIFYGGLELAIPLLAYKPSCINARVEGYEIPGDDCPKIFQLRIYFLRGILMS